MKVHIALDAADQPSLAADRALTCGTTLRTGAAELGKQIGPLTSLEEDLLRTAASIFAADLGCKRGMREDVNRSLELSVPVVNHAAMNAEKHRLERILHVLSDDNWTLDFRRAPGTPEAKQEWPGATGKTLLFSGGLDSFAGAVDLLDTLGPAGTLLASHVTGNTSTISAQNTLHTYLEDHYKEKIRRIVLKAGPKSLSDLGPATDDPEVSQRTRSFMFLTIAALGARRTGMHEVVFIAENGQMAIHVPLSAARIGAFSTHTAHPEFVAEAALLFSAVLDHTITIQNPYLYQTKAEVIATVASKHAPAIVSSNSCWRNARVHGHCGACIPCCIRRIALERFEIKVDDWKRDIFAENLATLPETDEGKRNLSELAEFVYAFGHSDDASLDIEFPELNSPFFKRDEASSMYQRFAAEATSVWTRYPGLTHLLK